MVESSVLTYTTTLGYGKHIWDFEIDKLPALLLPTSIAGTLTVTATAWSKTSFGITLLHITSGWYNKMTWFCIISMNFIMAVAAVMFWISCKPVEKTWNSSIEGTCWEPHVTVIYHLFAGGYSALVDFTFAALPWKFLWSLQMRRKEKLGVMLAMSMGIFAGATAVVKTTKVPRMLSADIGKSTSNLPCLSYHEANLFGTQPTVSLYGYGVMPRSALLSLPLAFQCSESSFAT